MKEGVDTVHCRVSKRKQDRMEFGGWRVLGGLISEVALSFGVWRLAGQYVTMSPLLCFFFGSGCQNQQHLKPPCFQFFILEVRPLLNAMKMTHATPAWGSKRGYQGYLECRRARLKDSCIVLFSTNWHNFSSDHTGSGIMSGKCMNRFPMNM